MATGYEAVDSLPSDGARLNVSYAVASRPPSPDTLRENESLIWETVRPYYYVRTTPDHRILMGGADEPMSRYSFSPTRLRFTEREPKKRFHELFPAVNVAELTAGRDLAQFQFREAEKTRRSRPATSGGASFPTF